jgi:hypothetical protein
MPGRQGFLAPLLDVSSSSLLAERMARAYGAAVVCLGILAGTWVVYGFARHPGLGLLFAIGAAAAFGVLVLIARLLFEMALLLVRIADQTEEIAEQVAGISVEATSTRAVGPAVGAKSRRP